MSRNADTREIMSMFSYARPIGSRTEQAFVDRYLTPLGFRRDRHKNLWVQIDTPDHKAPRVLFSSHVDTVDRTEGIKSLHYGADGMLALSRKDKAQGFSCLGADDTAGIWLMVQMIRAEVPGVYLIHHGEESGCIGSGDLARLTPDFLDGIDIALAFDRAGYTDVITHQCGGRTASNGFAWSLARQLGGQFEPSDGGVYTDTNEYAGLVPECSNLSVGYFRQHSQEERQDVPFLIRLRDDLINVDWAGLNVERNPYLDNESASFGWKSSAFWDDDVSDADYFGDAEDERMKAMVEEYPGIAASVLEAFGIKPEDFAEEIERQTGRNVWGRYA